MKIDKKFGYLNIGLALASFTLVNFLIPSKLMAGGTTGIAIILYHLYELPVSTGYLVLNAPLVLLGGAMLGKEYGIKTIYSIVAISFYTEVITKYLRIEQLEVVFENHQWLGALSGGILIGLGLGIAMCMGGNGGGTSIVAQILEKYFRIKIGTTLNIADTIIVSLSGLILGGSSALFTIISLLITGKIINLVKYRGVGLNEGNF